MASSDPDQESFENSEHSDKCSQVQVNGNTAAKKDSSSHADIADQRDDRNEHTDVQEEPGEDLNLADLFDGGSGRRYSTVICTSSS